MVRRFICGLSLTAAAWIGVGVMAATPAVAGPVGLSIPFEKSLERAFVGGREGTPRGPIEIREEWVLAQMRLTLPQTSPDMLAPDAVRLFLGTNRGNDFGWNQTSRGEDPRLRRFLVDAEHQTVEVRFSRGISRSWSVGVRLPVHFRGAGFLDGITDLFHETTGLADNLRESFFNDRYRIEGRLDDGRRFSWNDSRGWGLGNLEISAKYAITKPTCRADWRVAAIGRVQLPTATGAFRTESVDVGAQLVFGKKLANRLDVYGGIGATWFSNTTIREVEYEPLRGSAFLAFEWQIDSKWSLLLDTTYTSRLIDNILRYQADQWYWNVGAKVDLSRRAQLEFGITENIANQQTTIDIGFFLGIHWRW